MPRIPIVVLVKRTIEAWFSDNVTRMSAALAYFTLFAIAPLLVIVVYITQLALGEPAAIDEVVTQLSPLVGARSAAAAGDLLRTTVESEAGPVATALGLAALLFAAMRLFTELQTSLNDIWGIEGRSERGPIMTFLRDRLLAFGMVLLVGAILFLTVLLDTVLSVATDLVHPLQIEQLQQFQATHLISSVVISTLLFAVIFKILPDAEIAWGDVWIGALVTAVLFSLGRRAISYYFGQIGIESTYGAAGSLVVLLLGVYYSAQIFFIGAEFTHIYAELHGTDIRPKAHARHSDTPDGAQHGDRSPADHRPSSS